jgi:tetratricopeptide (TPR) repeat protein
MAPIANIIIVTGRPVAEQRLYLPSIGFCFILGYIFNKGLRFRKHFLKYIMPLSLIIILGFYSYGTVDRNFEWSSPLTLWESAVKVSPKTERAHRNLAGEYIATGDEDKAIKEFETILNLEETERAKRTGQRIIFAEPQPLGALVAPIMPITNETEICEMREKLEKEENIRMVHPDAEIHKYLGDAYKRRGDLKRAAYEYNMAIIYDPASYESYNSLGIVYDMAGFDVAAIVILEKGTKIKSDFHPLYHNLGIAYEHANKYNDSIKQYEKVIELSPDYDQPHLRLSIIYAKYELNLTKAKYHWSIYLNLTHFPDPRYIQEFQYLLN